MPYFPQPKQSTQTYTTSNVTPLRTIDPTTISTSNAINVLATLVADLKAAGILQ